MSHGMRAQRRKETVMDTKNAGRAAPPGESLFSSLFNVAARGGKSPRVSIVRSVYGGSAAPSSPATPCVALQCASSLRSRRQCESSMPHARLAGDPGQAYISRIVVIPSSPARRPIRSTRSRGDLTVTTRPGVVAFHRSRFSCLASPCSGGGAACGATGGANFNREVHP